jgi:hypothetical protein
VNGFLPRRAAGTLRFNGGVSLTFVAPARFQNAPVSGSGLIFADYRDST